LRRARALGVGSLVWEDLGSSAVAFHRGDLHVAVNIGAEPLELGDDITFVVQSQPFEGTALPVDHAAWYTKA
jgi:alpha-glucosidase